MLPRPRWVVAAVAGLAGIILVLAAPATASAHALLVRSEPGQGAVLPREPSIIHLWFSEDLNTALSKAVVWNAKRVEVDRRDDRISHNRELTVSLRSGLPDGTYLVLWTSVSSQDGHVLKGGFLFSIGHRGPAPPAPTLSGTGSQNFPPNLDALLALAARTLELVTSALWLGLALLLLAVLPSPSLAPEASALTCRAMARAVRILPITLLLMLAARCGSLLIQAHTVAGDWGSTFDLATFRGLLLDTEYGHIWIAAQAVGVVGLLACLILRTRPRPATAEPRRRPPQQAVYSLVVPFPMLAVRPLSPAALQLLLAAGAAFLLAASGHAATVNLSGTGTGIATAPVVIDWLHVLATGLWAGGILAIALTLLPAAARNTRTALVPFLDTLDRFSPFAYASVLTLVFTGGFNGKVHVPSWNAFFNSIYGRTLIVKMGLVLLMVLISAFTVGIVRPRLRRATKRAMEAATPLLQAMLMRWLRISAVLALLVFAATAVLNAYPVPITFGAVSGPFTLRNTVEGLQVSLSVTPGKAGPDTFTVHLRRGGVPVRLATVNIVETMTDMDMGTQFLTLPERGPGKFSAPGQVLMGGHWQYLLEIRIPGRSRFVDDTFHTLIGQ